VTARPPAGLPGLDPAWSRYVESLDADRMVRRWHLLDTDPDTDPAEVQGIMLCVHGNPTWSYLWRRFLSARRPGWRVIAVDQLGMGYSDHPTGSLDRPRTLAHRIDDLTRLTDTLGIGADSSTPVVAVGHDWGGVVASGWALRHRERGGHLAGLVLANTSVHHDFEDGLPLALRVARWGPLHAATCVTTPLFVRAATALSRPPLPREVRDAFAAPYPDAASRSFVGQFVADIPAEPQHPTRATFDRIATALTEVGSARIPALLLRGPADPVFSEVHLRDLRRRLPHAQVHRYEGAGHLVTEDAPRTAADTWNWIASVVQPSLRGEAPNEFHQPADDSTAPAWSALLDRVRDTPDDLAVAEVRSGRRVSFVELEQDITNLSAGLLRHGVTAGDRVALLVPPGIDLTVILYACWRIGAVVVVADAGLGARGMGRALRGAGPDHVIAIAKGLLAVRALRVPGHRILVHRAESPLLARAVGAETTLDTLRTLGRGDAPAPQPPVDAECAILFTSGATGPAKGVVYRSDQIKAQAGHIRGLYSLSDEDRFVAAFAPFALYGPAMGVGSVVPDMDVTAPATLTATGLADAVLAAEATTVFASPASLRNVVATSAELDDEHQAALARIRVAMSAGAPIPLTLLHDLTAVMPAASLHTPYGMTECLPVSDVVLDELEAAGTGNGVCVGRPWAGVEVLIAPLPSTPEHPDGTTVEDGELTAEPGVTGEIVVSAEHVKDHYDQLWATQSASTRDGNGAHGPRHRTGDVGHFDGQGRLWVEGRRAHVVHTAVGPLTPVGLELRIQRLPAVRDAAVVGVGPIGTQAVVVVLQLEDDVANSRVGRLAADWLTAAVRAAAADVEPRLSPPGGPGIAAVLWAERFPVDIRHQSKVDRSKLARWASRILAGQRVGHP